MPTPLKQSYVKLYVDPKSGLLRRKKRLVKRRGKAETPKIRRHIVSPNKQLHLLNDGGWWEVTLADVPTGVWERKTRHGVDRVPVELSVVDVVARGGLTSQTRAALYGRAGVYATAKRQLSKKEMRDLELR